MNSRALLLLALPLSTLAQSVVDKPIQDYQRELLDIAFQAASAFPTKPHIKNRCRNQEAVVAACFELEQPRRAIAYVEKIDDWRQGKGYADYAVYCARNGAASEVRRYVDLAEGVALRSLEHPDSQDWQIERIRVTIAEAHAWLGDLEKEKASEPEAGTAAQASFRDPAAFDREVEVLDHVVSIGNFDQICASLQTCAELYGRFYEDADRRNLLEKKIKASFEKLPPQIRVETLTKLADFALDHGDRERALSLARDVQTVVDAGPWQPEDQIACDANLASLYSRAGDAKNARTRADAAHERFQTSREKITSIFRGRALRPLAEAYHAMGKGEAALAIYKLAVEESVVNPNSRPRADDLCALCCSMAVHGVEPDEDLTRRLAEVCAGLGEPW